MRRRTALGVWIGWRLLWALLLIPGTAQSEPVRELVIGVQDFRDYLPYSEIRDGDYRGFNRELLDLFAQHQGYRFRYQPFPIKRLYLALLNGQIDLKYPDNPYWSAELKQGQSIRYSEPVVEFIDGVLVTPQRMGRAPDQLRHLAILAGFTPLRYLEPMRQGQLRVTEVFSYPRLLSRTLRGDFDGAYANISVARHYLRDVLQRPNDLRFDASLPHTRSQRHLSSLRHPRIIDEFDAFLRTQRDQIDRLKRKYRVAPE